MVNGYLIMVNGYWLISLSMMKKLQCGAPKIAKLVNITPMFSMVYGTYNYSSWGL